MKYIRQGIKANILGKDIGDDLSYMIRKSKKKTIPSFLKWLDKWAEEENEMLKKKGKKNYYVVDKVDCLQKVCEGAQDLEEAQENIKKMFKDETGKEIICLSSIHRSKGLERDNVFILYDTIKKTSQEDRNIEYVAITRTKKKLYLVSKNN